MELNPTDTLARNGRPLRRICGIAAVVFCILLANGGGWWHSEARSAGDARLQRNWQSIGIAGVVKRDVASASFGSANFALPQAGCTYTLSSTSRTISSLGTLPFTPDSDPRNIPAAVLVKTNPGCAWTSSSNAPWL